MDKEYDNWNLTKKKLSKTDRVYFNKGDVWFASIGKNIGDEEDGKNSNFGRSILIIRKFNNNIFLAAPLTSQEKGGKYYHKLISFSVSTLILSQIRLLDSKRLLRKIGKIENEELKDIKIKIRRII